MIKVLLTIVKIVLNIFYFFIKLLPTKSRVVFMSRQSNKISTDFKLLGDKLKKNYKVKYLCRTLEGKEKAKMSTRIKYGLHMFTQMYYLATSKVCILDTYIPTISILHHKKSLTIIQLWHSIGTMKKFGYTSLDTKEGNSSSMAHLLKMHKNYDIVFGASEAYKDHLASGFNIDRNKILIYTLPHIDYLKDKKYETKIKNKIYKKYPILKKKKNIVYAPTFRKDERVFKEKLLDFINNFNYDKYNLVIKLHPLSKIKIDDSRVIFDNTFSTFDMLFVTNKLVSDYSCVIYEAGIRNIPLYFYDYDIKEYENNRGLALDYNELPGYREESAKELVKSFEKEYDIKYLHKFIKKYVTNTDNCTNKMVSKIKEFL